MGDSCSKGKLNWCDRNFAPSICFFFGYARQMEGDISDLPNQPYQINASLFHSSPCSVHSSLSSFQDQKVWIVVVSWHHSIHSIHSCISSARFTRRSNGAWPESGSSTTWRGEFFQPFLWSRIHHLFSDDDMKEEFLTFIWFVHVRSVKTVRCHLLKVMMGVSLFWFGRNGLKLPRLEVFIATPGLKHTPGHGSVRWPWQLTIYKCLFFPGGHPDWLLISFQNDIIMTMNH